MMDELIAEVSSKTGLSPDQARNAVCAVLGVLKTRLPGPLAGCIDSMTGGSTDAAAGSGETIGMESGGLAGEASTLLGSFFGSK